MLRKIIAAAALAASAAIAIAPGAALAQDRGHRDQSSWQTQRNYGGRHGNIWVGRGGRGQGA